MKTTTKFRIAVTVMMLIAGVCPLVGVTGLRIPGGGFLLPVNYIDALFRTEDSPYRLNFTIYLWVLIASSGIAVLLVWIRGTWTAFVAGCVCLSSLVYHVVRTLQNRQDVFRVDSIFDLLMLTLPLIAAILSFALFRKLRQEA